MSEKTPRQSEYAAKFRDPRWQRKRLEIMQRDEFACQKCYETESTLNVHHRYYQRGKEPWEYADAALVTLCENCHEDETAMLAEAKQVPIEGMSDAGFFASDLHDIGLAFHGRAGQLDERVSSALAWAISDRSVLSEIVDAYFRYLRKNHEEQKAQE